MALVSGCSAWNTTREVTSDVYTSYVDVDPEINLNASAPGDASTRLLAQAFTPVDAPLHRVVRRMESQETFPDAGWITRQLETFSWLNGIVVIDREGEVLQQQPKQSVKEIETGFVRQGQDDWAERQNRLTVQQTPLGPECVLTQPFYKDNVWQGLIIAHFDPRSLAERSPHAEQLLVFTPEEVLWAGSEVAGDSVLEASWKKMLTKNDSGRLTLSEQELDWTVRYIGPDPLLYAVTEEAQQAATLVQEVAQCDK
ncbi:MAG: hypothetical protein ACQESV_01355 [Thermodesulfobacteriota bacterium]